MMKPTMKIRYMQRGWKNVNQSTSEYTSYGREPFYVLQQWWYQPCPDVDPEFCDGEWRDIPIEVEE